jgi:serine protease AprX
LILLKYPELTPDQVKRFITDNAKKVPGADSQAQGAGELRLSVMTAKDPRSYTQKFNHSTGSGSLEAARGQDHVAMNGVALRGEKGIFGRPFDATAMATAGAQGTTWSNGEWNGTTWSGTTWSDASSGMTDACPRSSRFSSCPM